MSARSRMNVWRVRYEARMSVMEYASEGSALRHGRHGLQSVGALLKNGARHIYSVSLVSFVFRVCLVHQMKQFVMPGGHPQMKETIAKKELHES
jgi:hypothetical protein